MKTAKVALQLFAVGSTILMASCSSDQFMISCDLETLGRASHTVGRGPGGVLKDAPGSSTLTGAKKSSFYNQFGLGVYLESSDAIFCIVLKPRNPAAAAAPLNILQIIPDVFFDAQSDHSREANRDWVITRWSIYRKPNVSDREKAALNLRENSLDSFLSNEEVKIYKVKEIISSEYIGGADFRGDPVTKKLGRQINWQERWSGNKMAFLGDESGILFVSRNPQDSPVMVSIQSNSPDVVSVHKCKLIGSRIVVTDYFYMQGRNVALRNFVAQCLASR